MRYRLPSLRTTVDRLALAVRMVSFLGGVAAFAALGLVDEALGSVWPAWRGREGPARWAGQGLTALALRIFPLLLVVPCARRQVRVHRLVHPRTLRPRAMAQVELVLENLSGETWSGGGPHPCRLGVIDPLDGSAFHVAGRWVAPGRAAELPTGTEIAPLERAEFQVPIQAPDEPGRYREVWGLVIEGRNWIPVLRGVEIVIDVREG